jgi:hypothetical protein
MAREEADARRAESVAKQQDADRTAGIYGPSADLNPEAAATLRAGGYGVTERSTLPARTLDMPTGDGGPIVPGVDLPSTSYSRRAETYNEQLARQQREAAQAEKDEQRRFRDEQATADRAFRGEQASANRDAAAERAQADRDMKLLIADMTRSGSAETRALGNELKRLQIQAAQDKLDNGPRATQGEKTADAFYSRAVDANNRVADVEAAVGTWEILAPNFANTTTGQQYQQAKNQFIESYLRKDSGAAIGKEEYANADRIYFPQIGDSAATRQQKQAARKRVLQSLQTQGTGNAATPTVERWGRDGNGRPVRIQ